MNYIELFAGCGGLSLGLKSVGFDLVFANELSPMAAETYAYNFLDEDLASSGLFGPEKTLWLSSKYAKSELDKRLRENPFDFPEIGAGVCDITKGGGNLDGALIVGSIVHLNQWLGQETRALRKIKNSFGRGDIDLVSGGPPCQGFSMAGLRAQGDEKNSLPWEFARFVSFTKPKVVLLENVTGILRPFTGPGGTRFHAWFEIAKAFAGIGYLPICLHINAKFVGVPQNRPRFIMIGVREDIFRNLWSHLKKPDREIFAKPAHFFGLVVSKLEPTLSDLEYFDIADKADKELIQRSFLSPLCTHEEFVTVRDAIDDLKTLRYRQGSFSVSLDRLFKIRRRDSRIQNHELRSNGIRVRQRFRVYQIIEKLERRQRQEVLDIISGRSHDLSEEVWLLLRRKKFFTERNAFELLQTKDQLLRLLDDLRTKKQTQRALRADMPAPAALSIPDDACHYDPKYLRTLTVREMARIQSFPDHFVFRSKVTTGGTSRRIEVPQYTQVGNAVPPLLGRALGKAIKQLLAKIQN